MKTIYFIRHAKSSWKDLSLDDFDRPLNKRGKANAPMMGKRLYKMGINPDMIISSDAKRAKKTAQKISSELNFDKSKIIYDNSLYDSSFNKYLKIIKNIDNKHKTIFIIGHNPLLTDFVNIVGELDIYNIPTCGIVCINFYVDSFEDIRKSKVELSFFDYPKNNK